MRPHRPGRVARFIDRACCTIIGAAYLWACAQYLLGTDTK